jgi:hypothetical protein
MLSETGYFGHRPTDCLYPTVFRKYHPAIFHARVSESMDSLLLGILLGFVAGYLVRALISQVRRRRFEEDYGLNPRSRLRPRS